MEARFCTDTIPILNNVNLTMPVIQKVKILVRNPEPEYISPDSLHAERSDNVVVMAQANNDLANDVQDSGVLGWIDLEASGTIGLDSLCDVE
ncbi:MAG: hypothetical protein KAU10_01010 [Dehalococcoidia bacterium]|nr:hypothetical protein [Dehalococcoidia bacterium]